MLQNQQAQQQQAHEQQQQQMALAAAESQLSPLGHQVMMPGQPMLHPGQVPGKAKREIRWLEDVPSVG